jgi:hypothetical protein
MKESLPVLKYSDFEETAFDVVPILEGAVDGEIVFGILSLRRADTGKDAVVITHEVYNGLGRPVRAIIQGKHANSIAENAYVIRFEDAYQRVASDRLASYLRDRRNVLREQGASTAVMIGKHPPIPAQKPVPVPEPKPEPPKPVPVVPQSPITMTELLLQIAAMQTDFDLRMQVMAQRIAVLEAK